MAGMPGMGGAAEASAGAGGAPPDCPRGSQLVDDVCEPIRLVQLALGAIHTCALLSDGTVKCWGYNASGQLGYGDTRNRSDQVPAELPPVSVTEEPGVRVIRLSAGSEHTCALLSNETVRCWGDNRTGQLGYGHKRNIGDDEVPSSVPPVSITSNPGVFAIGIATSTYDTCAVLSSGAVKCWGKNDDGQLGQGNTQMLGDDELPSTAPDVIPSALPGQRASSIVMGYAHVCVRLHQGAVQCWGSNSQGQLGMGKTPATVARIGDDEPPSSVPPVSLSTQANVITQGLSAGDFFTCARLSNGTVRCWGHNEFGELGYGNTLKIGDDELPSDAGPVAIAQGLSVTQIASGAYHTCARLSTGQLQCWGVNGGGQLGYGVRTTYIGDDEPLLPPYAVSATPGIIVHELMVGGDSTCAQLSDSNVKCWGNSSMGELGYGNTEPLGLDEKPVNIGVLRFF